MNRPALVAVSIAFTLTALAMPAGLAAPLAVHDFYVVTEGRDAGIWAESNGVDGLQTQAVANPSDGSITPADSKIIGLTAPSPIVTPAGSYYLDINQPAPDRGLWQESNGVPGLQTKAKANPEDGSITPADSRVLSV